LSHLDYKYTIIPFDLVYSNKPYRLGRRREGEEEREEEREREGEREREFYFYGHTYTQSNTQPTPLYPLSYYHSSFFHLNKHLE
jgi:hypothetical protein